MLIGIAPVGGGLPIDAVTADFVSGAAERISPAAPADHWDVIEGQGSLFTPAYAGVSLGLLHGSQPDAIVLCHDPKRSTISGCPSTPLPSLREAIELNLRLGRLTNPKIRCVGVSVNTSQLSVLERESTLARLVDETGLPCVDPLVEGLDAIVDQLA